jgi:DNA invertase Pin-like site-specific DNA recombinase
MPSRFIAYYRVSTQAQGRSGLGLEAQRQAVHAFLERGDGQCLDAFTETESGKNNDRPQLVAALAMCRRTKSALLVAKLDRLSRNVRFLLSVVEGAGDQGVVFCDLPHIPPGPMSKFIVTQMAAVAELEAGLISQRTKAALAEAKRRGTKLGGFRGYRGDTKHATERRMAIAAARAADLGPIVAPLRQAGLSLRQIGQELTDRGIVSPRGGAWTATAVKRVIDRGGVPVRILSAI